MARSKNTETPNDPTSQATQAATAAAAAANPSSTNVKMVKLIADLTDSQGNVVKKAGESMPRKDFIRHRWTENRVSRGQITKDLSAQNTTENGGDGKKIPYQVVFAVLKKGAESYGGPVANTSEGQAQTQTEGQAAA